MTGLFCCQCDSEIHGIPVREVGGGVMCTACLLESLHVAREKCLEQQDELIDLRAENVELRAVVAELKGIMGVNGATH